MEYFPDEWVIVKVKADDGHEWYRLFAAWYGDYDTGESWRMNSGIKRYVKDNGMLYFYGESGSVYVCYEEFEKIRVRFALSQLHDFLKSGQCEIVTFEQFEKEFTNAVH